jgi:hypothetical protein
VLKPSAIKTKIGAGGRTLVGLLLEAVGEGGGGGLVDDAKHLDPCNLAGILGGLALGVVEVGGDSDHSLRDGVSEELHRGDHVRHVRMPK